MTPTGRARWLLMIAGEYADYSEHVSDDSAFALRLQKVWPLFTYYLEEQCNPRPRR